MILNAVFHHAVSECSYVVNGVVPLLITDFRDFARRELKEVSGKDFEYNKSRWENHINLLSYPYKTTPLKKEIEY